MALSGALLLAGLSGCLTPDTGQTEDLEGLESQIWAPSEIDDGASLPLFLHLHGTYSSPYWSARFFPSHELVDELGFVQVMPRAPLTHWNLVGHERIEDLIDQIAARYPIDRRRIYVGGHSQGAAAALRFASKSDTPAAVVPWAGYGGAPDRAVSLFNLHGRRDLIVWPGTSRRLLRRYRRVMGCADPAPEVAIEAGSTSAAVEIAGGCEGGAEVRGYWADGMGHVGRWDPSFLEGMFEDLLAICHPSGCD